MAGRDEDILHQDDVERVIHEHIDKMGLLDGGGGGGPAAGPVPPSVLQVFWDEDATNPVITFDNLTPGTTRAAILVSEEGSVDSHSVIAGNWRLQTSNVANGLAMSLWVASTMSEFGSDDAVNVNFGVPGVVVGLELVNAARPEYGPDYSDTSSFLNGSSVAMDPIGPLDRDGLAFAIVALIDDPTSAFAYTDGYVDIFGDSAPTKLGVGHKFVTAGTEPSTTASWTAPQDGALIHATINGTTLAEWMFKIEDRLTGLEQS